MRKDHPSSGFTIVSFPLPVSQNTHWIITNMTHAYSMWAPACAQRQVWIRSADSMTGSALLTYTFSNQVSKQLAVCILVLCT